MNLPARKLCFVQVTDSLLLALPAHSLQATSEATKLGSNLQLCAKCAPLVQALYPVDGRPGLQAALLLCLGPL